MRRLLSLTRLQPGVRQALHLGNRFNGFCVVGRIQAVEQLL